MGYVSSSAKRAVLSLAEWGRSRSGERGRLHSAFFFDFLFSPPGSVWPGRS